jgi:ribosomal protein S18/ribosomal protein S6
LMVDPSLKDADRKSLLKDIEVVLWSNLLDTDDIGLQELVYDLSGKRGNNRAYFVSYYLQWDAASLDEIRKTLLYNKGILRYFLFAMTNTQPFHHFAKVHNELVKIIDSWEDTKFGQKLTFFVDKRNAWYISRKSLPMLQKYVTRFGDIKPRKYTNNSVQTQKKLRSTILRAREMGLLRYTR